MTTGQFGRSIGIAAGLCIAAWAAPLHANKQCYAPDARSQERAFSRAVTTDGGKTIWLGGQTTSLPLVAYFDPQVRDVFASIAKTFEPHAARLQNIFTI